MILDLQHIDKSYGDGKLEVPVLFDINLQVDEGEYVAIMGPSGSGKSTLMNIIGCLDVPTSGTYILDGENVNGKTTSNSPNCATAQSALSSKTSICFPENLHWIMSLCQCYMPVFPGMIALQRQKRPLNALV